MSQTVNPGSQHSAELSTWADQLPLPIASIDRDGMIHWQNTAWTTLTGHAAPQALRSSLHTLKERDIQTQWQEQGVRQQPFTLTASAAGERAVQLHAKPTPQGQWLVTLTDIQDHLQTQQELRQERDTLQEIVDANADCIKVLSLDGRLLSMNVGGMKVMEVDDFQACLNAVWPTFWQGETRVAADHALDEARSGRTGSFEGFCPTMKGTPRWWEVTISPIHDQAGEVINLLATSRDITQRHQAQQALRELNATLEQRVQTRTMELEQAVTQLQRSNQELERFAYVAAHDLQEPLRTVASFSDLLDKRYGPQLDERAHKYLHFINSGAKRMKTQVADLLHYSRLRHENPPLQPVPFDRPLKEALARLDTLIQDSHASITHDDLPAVLGDGPQLAQVMQNLIGNALKFTRPGEPPHLHLSAQREGQHWHFTLKDNGIGIEPQHLEGIFQLFQRLHTRERYEGSGMGLPIVARIIEHHGGSIWAESQQGQGSQFHFTLQAAEQE